MLVEYLEDTYEVSFRTHGGKGTINSIFSLPYACAKYTAGARDWVNPH